jgi:hypothetical protein
MPFLNPIGAVMRMRLRDAAGVRRRKRSWTVTCQQGSPSPAECAVGARRSEGRGGEDLVRRQAEADGGLHGPGRPLRFGRPDRGNDKGKVEGLMNNTRANSSRRSQRRSTSTISNAMLAARCRARQNERVGHHTATSCERLTGDRYAFRQLPAVPLRPCQKRRTRVSSHCPFPADHPWRALDLLRQGGQPRPDRSSSVAGIYRVRSAQSAAGCSLHLSHHVNFPVSLRPRRTSRFARFQGAP